MTVDEFKSTLAILVAENRNHEAIDFVVKYLPQVRRLMSTEDRLLVADWMEGVEMALDLGVDGSKVEPRSASSA